MEVPEYLNSDYYGVGEEQFSLGNLKSDENFAVDEYLLDFSNEDVAMTIGIFDNAPGNCSDSSTVTAVDSCNSSVFDVDNQFSEAQFPHELYIPYDDLAELEWLSNFAEDSLSREEKDIHFDGSTRRLHLDAPAETKTLKTDAPPCKKREVSNYESIGRKCLHCAAAKTPQWRTGPMGPKTLCNACGVRFKSGRLVPEYRPASSPTFISTKHSNSHRKVLELRRQKEEIQSSIFCTTNGCDEFLIDYRNGRDFSYLI